MPEHLTSRDETGPDSTSQSDYGRMAKIALGAALYLVALAFMVGADALYPEDAPQPVKLILILVSAIIILIVTYYWSKSIGMVTDKDEPVAPSAKKSQKTLWLAGGIGGLIAVALIFLGDPSRGGENIFSNAPLAPIVAVLVALLYVVGTVLGSYKWHRTADEHERSASNKGAFAALYAYAIVAPVWWLGERASLLPAQEPMIVFVLVLTVYAATWTYFRGA